jgi:hypothetical protein
MPTVIVKRTKFDERFQGTCHRCGSEIEFLASELTELQHGRNGRYSLEDCLECKGRMWVYPHNQ